MRITTYAAAMTLIISTLVAAGTASASGVGFFGEYGRNIATSGGDIGNPPPAALDLLDRNEWALGLAYDSNLAQDRLTNYRLDFGYHHTSLVSSGFGIVTGTANGVMFNNALGLGVVRTPEMRLWVGPALRLNLDYYGQPEVLDFQLGLGPQAGLNFNLPQATATLSMAYNYKLGWFVDVTSSNNTLSHRDHYISVNLAIFFRSPSDVFEK